MVGRLWPRKKSGLSSKRKVTVLISPTECQSILERDTEPQIAPGEQGRHLAGQPLLSVCEWVNVTCFVKHFGVSRLEMRYRNASLFTIMTHYFTHQQSVALYLAACCVNNIHRDTLKLKCKTSITVS